MHECRTDKNIWHPPRPSCRVSRRTCHSLQTGQSDISPQGTRDKMHACYLTNPATHWCVQQDRACHACMQMRASSVSENNQLLCNCMPVANVLHIYSSCNGVPPLKEIGVWSWLQVCMPHRKEQLRSVNEQTGQASLSSTIQTPVVFMLTAYEQT